METIDLLEKIAYYERLIEDTKKLSKTAENSGYWLYRISEMEKVVSLIRLNMSLREACQQTRDGSAAMQMQRI